MVKVGVVAASWNKRCSHMTSGCMAVNPAGLLTTTLQPTQEYKNLCPMALSISASALFSWHLSQRE